MFLCLPLLTPGPLGHWFLCPPRDTHVCIAAVDKCLFLFSQHILPTSFLLLSYILETVPDNQTFRGFWSHARGQVAIETWLALAKAPGRERGVLGYRFSGNDPSTPFSQGPGPVSQEVGRELGNEEPPPPLPQPWTGWGLWGQKC